jgi:hypothetical protein
MPRQPAIPINVIGQASPALANTTQNMNNRLLAAMQETGATQRQAMGNQSQQIVAGIGANAATDQAQISEQGQTKRANIAAGTAQGAQQTQVQMNREQIESSDAQNAAQIRANAEAQKVQGIQQEMTLNLKHEQDMEALRYQAAEERQRQREAMGFDLEKLQSSQAHEKGMQAEAIANGWDMKLFDVGIAREDQALLQDHWNKEQALQKDANWMNFGLQGMNMMATLGVMKKMSGQEEAEARGQVALDDLAKKWQVVDRTVAGMKPMVQEKARDLFKNQTMPRNYMVAELVKGQGFHVTSDILTDKEKAANFVEEQGLPGYIAIYQALDAADEQVAAERATQTKSNSGLFDEHARELAKIRSVFGGILSDDKPLKSGSGSRGGMFAAYDQYHTGHGMTGIAQAAKEMGLTPTQLHGKLLGSFQNRFGQGTFLRDLMLGWGATPDQADNLARRMGPLLDVVYGSQTAGQSNGIVQGLR